MLSDRYAAFLSAPLRERLEMVRDPSYAATLRAWLGAAVVEDYRKLGSGLDERHLGGPAGGGIIFVPGVMGSVLASQGLGGIWWLDVRSRRHINDLRLAPDGVSDADARARIAAVAIDPAYEGFLAGVFKDANFECTGFPFDWRKRLTVPADRLAAEIDATRERGDSTRPHLVGHSMGGLIIRVALMRHPRLWGDVGKVVFVGSPHYGSPAIADYLMNHLRGLNLLALLGRYLDRATFRSLWGVLSLLPAPPGVYPGTRDTAPQSGHPCVDLDMYKAEAWRLGLDDEALTAMQGVLDGVAALHRDLYSWHCGLDQEYRDRILVIAGVGYETLFRVARQPVGVKRTKSRQPGNPHREGDGRVPLASACLEWAGETRYVHAEHGRLPSVPAVYSDILRWCGNGAMSLPTTPAGALSQHLGDWEVEPVAPALAAMAATNGEDPGYLDFSEVGDDELAELDRALEMGRLPGFNRVRLL